MNAIGLFDVADDIAGVGDDNLTTASAIACLLPVGMPAIQACASSAGCRDNCGCADNAVTGGIGCCQIAGLVDRDVTAGSTGVRVFRAYCTDPDSRSSNGGADTDFSQIDGCGVVEFSIVAIGLAERKSPGVIRDEVRISFLRACARRLGGDNSRRHKGTDSC